MAASSSSSRVSRQIKAASYMFKEAKRNTEAIRIILVEAKRKLEITLRNLLEVSPHERQEEIESLLLDTDSQLLQNCESQALIEVQMIWLSSLNVGSAEQEVVAQDTSEIEKSTRSARTAVECMKMEWRKGKELEDCPICMMELLLARVTPCSHSFHSVCLFKWLSGSIGSNSMSCPICRFYLLQLSHSDADQ